MRSLQVALCGAALMFAVACSGKPADQSAQPDASASATPADGSNAASKAEAKAIASLPAGTVFTVRLGNSVGTKTSRSGDAFTATLAEPIESNGSVLIPQGASAKGIVEEAVPKGRFKGASRLRLSLREITVDGKPYQLRTASVQRSAKGKGKRTATMIGGGAGLGALIGGLAGGGKGAAIGAVAGAGAGTAGAAYTGNNDIVLPAESALSFKLLQPLEIKR